MPQYARPAADTTLGSYTDQAGGTSAIYTAIDEESANDADYIQSPAAPSNAAYVTKLGTLEDPQSSSGHVVRYRYSKDQSGGAGIDLTVELRQGYTNESSLGTLIASWAHAGISEVAATAAQTLSAAEADAITDYANLYLRFIFTQV